MVLKITVCFFSFFRSKKITMSLKETEMMRESFCSGTFTEGGGPAGRGENTGPPSGVTGGHRRTHTDIHTQAFMDVLCHRESENSPECTA